MAGLALSAAVWLRRVGETLQTMAAAGVISWAGRACLTSPGDGHLGLSNAAGTAMVRLAAITNSLLVVYNASAGDVADIQLGNMQVTGVTQAAAGVQQWVGRSRITSPSNGALSVSNNDGSGARSLAEGLLATVTGIDTSSAAKQTLYTVPAGKRLVVTKLVARDPSAAITLAVCTFGFDAAASDVIVTGQDLQLSGLATTNRSAMATPYDAVIGAAAAVLGVRMTTQEAAADTVTIDVFGYLV